MAKANSGRANAHWRHGMCAGYSDYRYGSTKPVSLAPIWKGEKRQHQVKLTMEAMRDWRLSHFEHEGAARAGIRSELCLAGYAWPRSDLAAADVVEEALRRLGAKRPTWAQGQPEYVEPRENCRNCRGPLDAEAIAARRPFCSPECSTAMKLYRPDRYSLALAAAQKTVTRRAWRAAGPLITCEQCGTQFGAREDGRKFCSKECRGASRRVDHTRTCRHCGKTFTPSHRGNRERPYCSTTCSRTHERPMQVCRCIVCEAAFLSKRPDAIYCSNPCRNRATMINLGRIRRITPPVFDYVFRIAA